MNWNEMTGKRFVFVPVLRAIVSAVMVNGCLSRAGPGGGGIPHPPRRAGRFRGKAVVSAAPVVRAEEAYRNRQRGGERRCILGA